MRRLAIFDPVNGRQPMQSPDGRFTLVFNGAIYNFRELRKELAGGFWQFRTECDTEVLLAAFARWGEQCLGRLRGMFAFAVWDATSETLFLARDPFGMKPLYYRQDDVQLMFASELNALISSELFTAVIDPPAVGEYLAWLAVPAPRTIYRGIFSLRPGECATFHGGQLDIRTAWNFGGIPREVAVCRTRPEFIAELRTRLEDSVRAHAIADVPVGAFLSGGLDSAAVVALMHQGRSTPLRTFSIDFEEAGYSEATEAAATARHLGTHHQATVLTGADVARDVEKLLSTLDQPTGDGLNTYYASQAARAGGVTVALSGLGGDELFGGYPSFRDTPRIARWLRPWRALPRPARAALVAKLQRGDTRRRKLADVLQHARNLQEVGSMQRRVFSEPAARSLLTRDVGRSLGPRIPFHPELDSLSVDLKGSGGFEVVSAWELHTYMADVLLRDSDVMSMRHSLELRVPLVDRPLIEWLWRQPAALKADPRHPKAALAEALHDLLPPDLAARRKRGFTVPFAVWMKRELRPFLEETFSDASLRHAILFDRPAAQQLWRGFLAGHDTREWSRVWSLAVLIAFVNRRSTGIDRSVRRSDSIHISTTSAPAFSSPLRPPPSTLVAPPAPPVPTRPATRTLLLAPEIFSSEGGIPRILQSYLKALCELTGEGGGVRLLALNDRVVGATDLRRVANDRLEDWSACDRSKARCVKEALRMIRGCDHLVCGHVFLLPVAWLARRLNPRLRYHLVAHGIEVWRPFSLAERIALRGADSVLCVSDYTRQELLKNCPLPDDRAVVLHNALDSAFPIVPGRPLAECAPIILVVTRLTYADRYKGVQHMIEAMPAIRAEVPAARLRIVGHGDDRDRLEALAGSLGVRDAVEFTGFISDRRLTEEMSRCRLFALPSRKEGFGLVFLEAMAHGRPCIGGRAGGIPEVITDESGVLVDYGDVPQLAQACIGALQREWDQIKILERARHFSYENFRRQLAGHLFR